MKRSNLFLAFALIAMISLVSAGDGDIAVIDNTAANFKSTSSGVISGIYNYILSLGKATI